MSDSSKAVLYSMDEVSWGTTPAIAFDTMRAKDFDLQPVLEFQESEEIVDDAQVQDLVLVSEAARLSANGEFSYSTYDKWIAGALRAAWPGSPVTVTGTTYACDTSDDSITDSANGFVTAGFVAGQIIKVSGFTTAANNGYFVVLTVAAGKITVDANLTTEVAGDTVTIKGTPIVNGSTLVSHTQEVKFVNDAGTSHFLSATGLRCGGFTLSIAPKQKAQIGFNFLGKKVVSGSATVGTGAANAATTTGVMNSVDNVALLRENSTAIQVTKLDLAVDTGLRMKEVVGTRGAIGIGQGQFKLTGSIEMYLEDRDLIDKALNVTASKLHLVLADAAGNVNGLSLPRLKYGEPRFPIAGNNQDIKLTLPFTSVKDTTLSKTLYWTRIAA